MERVEKDYNVVAMSKRSFSAFLGIIDFDGLKFALFCDEAIVASAVDGIEIFEISSLFFLSYLD